MSAAPAHPARARHFAEVTHVRQTARRETSLEKCCATLQWRPPLFYLAGLLERPGFELPHLSGCGTLCVPGQVVWRERDGDLVPRQHTDVELPHLSGDMRRTSWPFSISTLKKPFGRASFTTAWTSIASSFAIDSYGVQPMLEAATLRCGTDTKKASASLRFFLQKPSLARVIRRKRISQFMPCPDNRS